MNKETQKNCLQVLAIFILHLQMYSNTVLKSIGLEWLLHPILLVLQKLEHNASENQEFDQ